ncbi:hypothetical protein H5410_026652 [Solanum commersonii]|uniref:Uncharacterized protein n=1 Tax=Solanum commersonii TaxID=4109 RepID=A0A9J5YZG2_SOLCO|nr:hypothetical protein H5410_026652 [Solanum commersonii]
MNLRKSKRGSHSATKDHDDNTKHNVVKIRKTTNDIKQLCSDYVELQKIPPCKFCNAKRFQYEPHGFYCGKGTIKLTSHRMLANLRNLYMRNDAESKNFQTYNNLFVFMSLGVNYDKDLAQRNHGIYTFKFSVHMYHLIDALYPKERKLKNLQLYLYDNTNEPQNKMSCSDKLHESIVMKLMIILKDNTYSTFLRSLTNTPNLQNFHIAL